MTKYEEVLEKKAGDLTQADLVCLIRGTYIVDGVRDMFMSELGYRRVRTCHDFGGVEGTNGEGYDFACSECGFCCDEPNPNYCPYCGAKVVE